MKEALLYGLVCSIGLLVMLTIFSGQLIFMYVIIPLALTHLFR